MLQQLQPKLYQLLSSFLLPSTAIVLLAEVMHCSGQGYKGIFIYIEHHAFQWC